jgi:hypothetical protein
MSDKDGGIVANKGSDQVVDAPIKGYIYGALRLPGSPKGGQDKKLVGYFQSDTGAINQLLPLWKFDDDADIPPKTKGIVRFGNPGVPPDRSFYLETLPIGRPWWTPTGHARARPPRPRNMMRWTGGPPSGFGDGGRRVEAILSEHGGSCPHSCWAGAVHSDASISDLA